MYMIDAKLEQGTPSVRLIDSLTGEQRFHWRGGESPNGERDWQGLFKRLMLLSCRDQLSLPQRAQSPDFGGECISCASCVDQDERLESINFNNSNDIISLLMPHK